MIFCEGSLILSVCLSSQAGCHSLNHQLKGERQCEESRERVGFVATNNILTAIEFYSDGMYHRGNLLTHRSPINYICGKEGG